MPGREILPPPGAQAALRAVRLLKLFTPGCPEIALSDIARLAGLKKTTAHRLLKALQSEGLVARNDGTGAYSLGPTLMALGVQALTSNGLRRRVRPILKQLARQSGETATLEVAVEDSMLILDEVAGANVAGPLANVGTRWPMYATSTGKAFIAFEKNGEARLGGPMRPLTTRTLPRAELLRQLESIRRTGVAEMIDELEDGFSGVGTVVRAANGQVVGAMSICGPTPRFGGQRRAWLATALLSAAAQLRHDA